MAAAFLGSSLTSAQEPPRLPYPESMSVDQVDDYFGTRIADPYRWLEDPNSTETRSWIESQNRVTFAYLEALPAREAIRQRLTELWDYERYGLPSKEGRFYVYSRNDGLQDQPVIYKTVGLEAEPEVLLDPNTLSGDGTVAVVGTFFSDDGRYVAYSLASSGSDWLEWRIRDVETGRDLPDVLKWSKFSDAAWLKDGSGFYYSRYEPPEAGEAHSGVNRNQTVYFHRLGTPQDEDPVIYARPDQPDWGLGAAVTEDGRFLLIYQTEGTEPRNRVFVRDLTDPEGAIEPFLDAFDGRYVVVGNDGERFYVQTDAAAPRGRLVAIDRTAPARDQWTVVIPEAPGRDVLASTTMVGDRFVAIWRTDAHERIRIYTRDGRLAQDVALPGLGTVGTFSARRRDREGFYAFTSFTRPPVVCRYDFGTGRSDVFRTPPLRFPPEDYETIQVFYPSRDGTPIPMFITARKGLVRDGGNPTYLYGYGGFDISLTPAFSPGVIAWLEMGGVYAVANLRGGGEYGREWHDAGRLHRKQNVFDDFIAAAEHLIAEGYTSTPKLAIGGGSNGGLLVGAVLNQRPDLFGAAVPQVGVMDMLRFHRFTIGWAWVSDYGSSETKEGFETLIRYSPLHNIRSDTRYPPTLITTADTDDRVVPAHSFKYAAALQAAQAGPAPILIRIDTRAGHGAGKPTGKIIEERADIWAFLSHVLAAGDRDGSR